MRKGVRKVTFLSCPGLTPTKWRTHEHLILSDSSSHFVKSGGNEGSK